MFFINENTGWAVGSMDKILYTNNGGISWYEYENIIHAYLGSVFFTNSNIGWIVGSHSSILSTINGGKKWNVLQINERNQSEFKTVFFINENSGWIGGYTNTLLKTTNGGSFWEEIIDNGIINGIYHL